MAGRLLVLCTWGMVALGAQFASAGLIVEFDVVVGGDLASQNQIQGRTIVRGNITDGFPSFGTGLNPSSAYGDVDTLVVGGSLKSNGITMQAGDARIGGARGSAGVNLHGSGSQFFEHDPTALARANSAVAQLSPLSDMFSNLVANSTWSTVGSNITFNATPGDGGIAVFNVPASIFSDQNANYALALTGLPTGTTFLFNVTDSLTTTPLGNFGSGFTNISTFSHILWNFADQSTTLTLSREWYGSILLPDTNLKTTSAINGSVYVGGDFTTSGEVRLPGYAGASVLSAPSAVPEPSSFVLLSLAGLSFAGLRLRRHRGVNAK